METANCTCPWLGTSPRVRSFSAFLSLLSFFIALPAFSQQPSARPRNVLLISIDTLRADRLGAYGYARASTPHLDRLAHDGVMFQRVFTPLPLTLPAHTSLFTSVYPPTHGVRDNGEALPSSVPTLAEQLHSRGYQTAAFVGAFVLDRRFGLARGFDTYWGDFQLHRFEGADPGEVQVRGDKVEAQAAQWLGSHLSTPFFLFVHFYDLHGPYSLPAAWRSRFAGRTYDGEIAYVDSLIGQLWKLLEDSGVASRTLLVITADHGEGLGDHGERTHGFFIYRSTIQVPLIVRLPGGEHGGRKVEGTTSLIDIAPTICAAAGVPVPSSFQGRSLIPAMEGHELPPVPAYSESLYAFRHFHSSPLYGLRDQKYAYIQAPRPELYALDSDLHEVHDLTVSNPAAAQQQHQQLVNIVRSIPRGKEAQAAPADVMQKLRSLGYLSGSDSSRRAAFPPTAGPDPKDSMALYRRFQDALELEERGPVAAAIAQLEQIASADPELSVVHIETGVAYQRLDQHEKAVAQFKAALATDAKDALPHYDLGVSLSTLGRENEAEQEFNVAIGLQPWFSRAYTSLALTQAHLGRIKEALATFDKALQIDPQDFDALLNRGAVNGVLGNFPQGQSDLERALKLEPRNAQVHDTLGTLAFRSGDLQRALHEYQIAVKLSPNVSSIHSDLGLLYKKLGRSAEAEAELRTALKLNPNNRDAVTALRSQ
jgi:arylsulfatase A-like enzyme/Flp pilus assembly protein TadD